MAAADALRVDLTSDEELLEQIAEGNELAFGVLYERYFPRVFSFVQKRIGNRADTEETVQEVFINVFSSLGSFRAEGPFAAWVLGVARHTVASRFKRRRHPTVPLEAEEIHGIDPTVPTIRREPTPLEHYECGERIARLEAAADQGLSADQRQLFELHHLRHRPIHEIARELRRSEDAVKSNLYRTRKVLLSW